MESEGPYRCEVAEGKYFVYGRTNGDQWEMPTYEDAKALCNDLNRSHAAGRKAAEKGMDELLEIAEGLVSDHLTVCEEYAIVPHLDDRLADWKKARGIR